MTSNNVKKRYGIPENKERMALTLTKTNKERLYEIAEEFKMTPSALIEHVIETDLAYKIGEYLGRR